MVSEVDWQEILDIAESLVANQVDTVFCDKVANTLELGPTFKVISIKRIISEIHNIFVKSKI